MLVLCLFCGLAMVFVLAGTLSVPDGVFLALIGLSLGFGLTAERFEGRKAVKIVVQIVLAMAVALSGTRLPVTQGAFPVLDGIVTILFIVGLMNFFSVLNFLDGLASLSVFVICSICAMVLNASVGTDLLGDATGVVFALSLCGLSLWFFLYLRPSSKAYMGDYGTLMLNLAASMVVIRTAVAQQSMINSASIATPILLTPFVLVVPMLLASIHREQKSLFRRSRLAFLLILAGHAPFVAVVLPGQSGGQMTTAVLGVASVIVWAGVVSQGRMLRGWTMRCMSEPIADAIWISTLITLPSMALCAFLGISLWVPLGSGALTVMLLALQIAFWRRLGDIERMPEVVIFGRHEDYRAAQFIFMNCEDLFGRRRARRSRVGLNSKHLFNEVRKELQSGNACLILGGRSRRSLIALRGYDDLIFARDCLLLRHLDRTAQATRVSRVGEFLQDVAHRAVAAVGLIFLSPVFFVVIAAIRLEDGGPAFFRQRRVGRKDTRFTLYKFRSMSVDAQHYDLSPTTTVDARITRVGRWIRMFSIDELPQLVNVAQGHMRLVGPRPEMPFICSRYTPEQRRRLAVPPGITGLWQISPHRNAPIHDHVEYDLAYSDARGPILDLAILAATVLTAIKTGF